MTYPTDEQILHVEGWSAVIGYLCAFTIIVLIWFNYYFSPKLIRAKEEKK